MEKERVDFLKRCLRLYPGLRQDLQIHPPKIRLGGVWRRIQDVRMSGSGVSVSCSGRWFLLHSLSTLQQWREAQSEQIVRLLRKAFHPRAVRRVGWKTDRARHWSGSFLKLMLKIGNDRLPVVAAYEDGSPDLSGRLLASLVLWWDHLRGRRSADRIAALIPALWGRRIVNLLSLLDIPVLCYHYSSITDEIRRIYPAQSSDTRIQSPYVMYPLIAEIPEVLSRIKEQHPELDLLFRKNRWEISYRGFPVAWSGSGGDALFDFANPRPLDIGSMKSFRGHLEEILQTRVSSPPDPRHLNYRFAQERWLESSVVRHWSRVGIDLEEQFYCQVPTWVEGDRKILDLLALAKPGRAVVMELKVEKDLGILFQGLDYWDRVRRHLERGDFEDAGYFPGFRLSKEPPDLVLISPLFEYHRLTTIFRRYLLEPRRIYCIGINADWKRELRFLRRFML